MDLDVNSCNDWIFILSKVGKISKVYNLLCGNTWLAMSCLNMGAMNPNDNGVYAFQLRLK